MLTHRRSFALLLSLTLCATSAACTQEGEGTDQDETTGDEDPGDGDPGDGDPGDGDPGDGDPGDGDPGDGDPGDGDGDPGVGDPAEAACQAFDGATPTPITAAASAAEAATASIVPDSSTVYQVTLPEGAAGYLELQIADWETMQAFFTVAEIDYAVTVESDSQVPGPREPDAACPEAGITDQRIFFPHWTPATIEFSATGPREILLMVVQVS